MNYSKEQIEKAFIKWHQNFLDDPELFDEIQLGEQNAKEQAEYLIELMDNENEQD